MFYKNNGVIFKGITDDCEGKSVKESNIFSSKITWETPDSDFDLNKGCSNFMSKFRC
jgi:hypothetical protein